MSDLYAFSRRLAAAPSAAEIYLAIEEHVANLVQRNVVLFEASHSDGHQDNPAVPEEMPHARSREIADAERCRLTTIDGRQTGNTWFMRRVSQRTPDFGVIAIDLGRRADRACVTEIRQRVDEALSDAAATLERLDVARALTEAKMRSETELLREALIGSVSHELRTPLASILGAATVLTQSPAIEKDERLNSLAGRGT